MSTLTRWLAPLLMAAGFGGLVLVPTTARADSGDDLVRVIVDVADVVLRGNQPYYRGGNYGNEDRLIVVRDNRGQPRYYRNAPRRQYANQYRNGPPRNYYANDYRRGHDYGRYGDRDRDRDVKCNKHGKCKVKTQTTYYDARYDRDRYGYRRDRDDD